MCLVWQSSHRCTNAAGTEIKETHAIIKEWVSTEQLISEEEKDWAMEKSVLLDLQQALGAEINELNTKLQETKEEAVGAAKQREDLTARKMRHFRQPDPCTKDSTGQWQNWSGPLPCFPLLWQTILLPIAKNYSQEKGFPCYLYANGWTHLYHCFRQCKTSTVPSHWKDEFTLDDNQSREFQVMYFGLGAAYFVNESGTVAGYGKPTSQGWQWTRSDNLAREISTGVDMLNNRAMPRFLELPVISPERIDQ